MFNWFFNWLDPKILNMERWVNRKVLEPDKIDIDLDRVKKGEHKEIEMYFRGSSHIDSMDKKFGPFVANLEGAELLSFIFGPGEIEAFSLLNLDGKLWWRHRDAGVTHDFRVMAFDDMQEFTAFIGMEIGFWECVLRSEAKLAELKTKPHLLLKISDVKEYIKSKALVEDLQLLHEQIN